MAASVASGRRRGRDRGVRARPRHAGRHRGRTATSCPGPGEVGMVALGGRMPLGYYKDEAKSAATFRIIDGAPLVDPRRLRHRREPTARCACSAGGRSASTPAARRCTPRRSRRSSRPTRRALDAVVRGCPGRALRRGGGRPGRAAGRRLPWTRRRSSATSRHGWPGYKAPKRVFAIHTLGRAANGKVDYKALRARASSSSTDSPPDKLVGCQR